jgi:hypothetical protein
VPGVTSDSDDLEQQLRQDLKLRRELLAEVAKAKGGGFAYRLGWGLYWTCLALIVLYGAFWFVRLRGSSWEVIVGDLKDWTAVLELALPVVGLYALGRAFRYVLSGE